MYLNVNFEVGPAMGPSNLQMVQSASSLVPIEFYLTLPTSDIEIEIAESSFHKVYINIYIFIYIIISWNHMFN